MKKKKSITEKITGEPVAVKERKRKTKALSREVDEEEEVKVPQATSSATPPPPDTHDGTEDSDSDPEGDPSKMVHESLAHDGKPKHTSHRTKFVPEDETSEKRDERTIFIGNVPVDVITDRVHLIQYFSDWLS